MEKSYPRKNTELLKKNKDLRNMVILQKKVNLALLKELPQSSKSKKSQRKTAKKGIKKIK